MKISELIKEFQETLEAFGDLNVEIHQTINRYYCNPETNKLYPNFYTSDAKYTEVIVEDNVIIISDDL